MGECKRTANAPSQINRNRDRRWYSSPTAILRPPPKGFGARPISASTVSARPLNKAWVWRIEQPLHRFSDMTCREHR